MKPPSFDKFFIIKKWINIKNNISYYFIYKIFYKYISIIFKFWSYILNQDFSSILFFDFYKLAQY